MPPRTTIWPLDPQTLGKHQILRQYLNAWLPILGAKQGRILYVDGFAGPGEYIGGHDGSPIIALKSLMEHSASARIGAEFRCLFIEADNDRADHLEGLVQGMSLPQNRVKWEVKRGEFATEMTSVLDRLDAGGDRMAPAFVMIDPFGVSGAPMSIIRRIFTHPSSEVFVSFMTREMARFIRTPEMEGHLNDLFGSLDWQQARAAEGQEQRKGILYEVYEEQLRASGARFVLKFELYKGQELVYAIFFATQQERGCEKMKDAIWKVIPMGDFTFRGFRGSQTGLALELDPRPQLQEQLQNEFGGRWVAIETIETFMKSDRTLFRHGHLKQTTLSPMEAEGLLEVRTNGKRPKGSFPRGSEILICPL